ncbi:MAG: hypothetical protein J6C63_03345 [Lachnospiraceae bacterium]|nr:hypothetical protein [Lachnospiraceae bacterium]
MINGEKMIIGYDLSYRYAQISYCRIGADTPQTYAPADKARQFNIPLCLFKRNSVNQWFLGREALAVKEQEEGHFLDNLFMQALQQEEVALGEESYEWIALLALFIKRSLYLPGKECRPEKVSGIMFTLPVLTEKTVELMQQLIVLLNLPECKIAFQGREESIYYYITRQPKELWRENVLIYDSNGENIIGYRFKRNQNTRPVVAFVEEKELGRLYGDDEQKDGQFLQMVQESAKAADACAFLLGEGFHGEWSQDSLRLLCHNRRVFKGNDLYSKGACFGMQEKMAGKKQTEMIFLSKDKLRTNVGMQVMRSSQESYLAVLDGGENWYDCSKEWDVILTQGNELVFTLTPLDGRNIRNVEVVLDELPKRRDKMTRLRLRATMKSSTVMEVEITDMGFGDFAPASGMRFMQQIDLSIGEV